MATITSITEDSQNVTVNLSVNLVITAGATYPVSVAIVVPLTACKGTDGKRLSAAILRGRLQAILKQQAAAQ
jgi:hypothetical protein